MLPTPQMSSLCLAWCSSEDKDIREVYGTNSIHPWKRAPTKVLCPWTHTPLQAGLLSLNRKNISQALSPLLTQLWVRCTRESRWWMQVSMCRQWAALSKWFRTIPTGKNLFGIDLFGNNNSTAPPNPPSSMDCLLWEDKLPQHTLGVPLAISQ